MVAPIYRGIEPLLALAWDWTLDSMPPSTQADNLATVPLSLDSIVIDPLNREQTLKDYKEVGWEKISLNWKPYWQDIVKRSDSEYWFKLNGMP